MSKYKNIEALGLVILTGELFGAGNPNENYVKAADLEALLEKGVRMYGYKMEAHRNFSATKTPDDEVQGLLIDIKPIPKPKPVTKAEIDNYLFYASRGCATDNILDFLKRIRDAGVE